MRRVAVGVGVASLMLLVAVAVSVAASGPRTSNARQHAVGKRTHKRPGPFANTVRSRAMRTELRRLKHLAAPAARSEREQSQFAFSGQTADQAFGTFRSEFPSVVTGPASLDPIKPDDHVLQYNQHDHAAVVVSGMPTSPASAGADCS
jgi:hypothetical protein